MKIVADNTVPYLKGIAEPIAEVNYLTSKEFTPENVKNADALIVRSIDKCTRELLEGSRVKLITSATIGFRPYRHPILRRGRYRLEELTGMQCRFGRPICIRRIAHDCTPKG